LSYGEMGLSQNSALGTRGRDGKSGKKAIGRGSFILAFWNRT